MQLSETIFQKPDCQTWHISCEIVIFTAISFSSVKRLQTSSTTNAISSLESLRLGLKASEMHYPI